MDWAEAFKMFSDGAVGLAALGTAWMARKGVDAWSRELRGRAQFETARALLRSVLRLRDALQAARSPYILFEEFSEAYRVAGSKRDAATVVDGYLHMFNSRWAPVWEAYSDVQAQALEAEALWGAKVRSKAEDVRTVVRLANSAVHAYLDNLRADNAHFNDNPEFGQKVRSEALASHADEDNALNRQLRDAVKAVEDELQPHLRREKAA